MDIVATVFGTLPGTPQFGLNGDGSETDAGDLEVKIRPPTCGRG
jgi:hypothetical protein